LFTVLYLRGQTGRNKYQARRMFSFQWTGAGEIFCPIGVSRANAQVDERIFLLLAYYDGFIIILDFITGTYQGGGF